MGKYALIITEKPDAAKRIAQALDYRGKPKKVMEKGVPYFLAQRDRELVVVPALGHLYTVIHERGRRNYYPVFNFKWAPRHLVERGAKQIGIWIQVISKLANDAEAFITACDYDLEGSLIGYCVLKYACGNKENVAKRMKFSTLVKKELEKAYEGLFPQLDFVLIEAGRTRHEVDWLYGVNLSRALTLAARRWSGKYSTLSTGRVQGPTLKLLVEREKAIRGFVPTPYWEIRAEIEIKKSKYEVEYGRKRIEKKAEADAVVRACTGKIGKVKEVAVRNFHQRPPTPFDLGTLQTEAYRLFGYTPSRALRIAQRLYIDALISYPRTSSQKLPEILEYRKILDGLSGEPAYKKLASTLLETEELKPREGAKEDPAHPAVYPTGNLPERGLSDPEKKIWDLIIRRFMAVFGETAIKQRVKISLEVDGHTFFLRGRRILKQGWMQFYKPYVKVEEVLLPQAKEGERIKLKQVLCDDKFTYPPPRYNPSSLLKKMEKLGIGTKATRADIIETLYRRRYITDERITVTELGFTIIDILRRYAPKIVSVKLTQELEKKMEQIQGDNEKREKIVLEAVEQLKPSLEQFKEKEGPIGKDLSNTIRKAQMRERIVGTCPTCGTGNLMILNSRKTKKRFIGCTNYFEGICRTSFPLPQRGTAKPVKTNCRSCGWPIVRVYIKGRRPWRLCFNPDCPLKKERKEQNEVSSLQ